MDIDNINIAIQELEQSETTYKNIQELAFLYIVRDNYTKDNVEKEINDIIPAYRQYCKDKREYQLGRLTESYVLYSLDNVCKEIYEFIDMIYTYVNIPEERNKLHKLITELYKQIKD